MYERYLLNKISFIPVSRSFHYQASVKYYQIRGSNQKTLSSILEL